MPKPKVKKPHFAPQNAVADDGWTEWICPKPTGYLAQCCDCGLVHEIDSRVVKYEPRPSEAFDVADDPDLQVQWRVRRRDDLKSPESRVFEMRDSPVFITSQIIQEADILASDMPGTVVQKLEAAFSRFYKDMEDRS